MTMMTLLSLQTRARLAGLAGVTSLLLAACGGGGDGLTTAPSTPDTPAVALQPLAGGSTYLGTLSVGDTVAITLDGTAKKVSVRFAESRFGLAGTIASAYTDLGNGTLEARAFSAVDGSGVPAALAAKLSGLTLRFTSEGSLVHGSFGGLPNPRDGYATTLQGQLSASNRGAARLADVAGVYSFVKQWASYSASGAVLEAPAVEFGQLKIAADGSARACLYQAYSDTCSGGVVGKVASESDQTRFPGALSFTFNGKLIGRAYVAAESGATTLLVDEYEAGSNGSYTTGAWVLRSSAAAQSATALDGEWLCAEPEISAQGRPTGRSLRHYVSIGGGLLQTDTEDTDIALTANAVPVPSSANVASGLNGLFAGQWKPTSGSKTPARALLPVGANTFYYVGNNGTASTPRADLSGLCRRLPEQTPLATYASAPSNGTATMTITLGDARPTQPGIGYDQIFYKLGRYNNTANASTQWKKEFDDYCEASGLTDGAKGSTVVLGTSKLNDTTSFTCSTKTFDITSFKSAVVGPKGVLYLTDGHHTFTSFWEAPNGGGASVKVPVIMKGNFMDQNNATFWRGMRARKTVWLKTPDGRAITPAELPARLGLTNGLQDDAYRSLLYFTRGIGYDQPATGTEFLEFYWAEWLKASPQNFKLSDYTLTDATSYLLAIQTASNLMLATPDGTLIGSSGQTALQMGKRASFDNTTFTDLNTPVTATKPGKLAYALAWRASLATQ